MDSLGIAIFEDFLRSNSDIFGGMGRPGNDLYMNLFLKSLCKVELPYEDKGEELIEKAIKDYIDRLVQKKISTDTYLHDERQTWYGKELNPSRSKMVVKAFAEKEPVAAFKRILTYPFLNIEERALLIESCGKANENLPPSLEICF